MEPDVLSSSAEVILQVRFGGKFLDQNVANMTVGAQSLSGTGNPQISISYEGDLQSGFSEYAFKEAFRSRTNAGPFQNGLSAIRATNLLDVSAINGLTLSLSASDGSGPQDCTRGAGPARHCSDGSPGTDGHGACTVDADCGFGSGICNLDANCYFGPPVPVTAGALSACTLNAIATAWKIPADLLIRPYPLDRVA